MASSAWSFLLSLQSESAAPCPAMSQSVLMTPASWLPCHGKGNVGPALTRTPGAVMVSSTACVALTPLFRFSCMSCVNTTEAWSVMLQSLSKYGPRTFFSHFLCTFICLHSRGSPIRPWCICFHSSLWFWRGSFTKKSVNWAIEWLQNASFVRGYKTCSKHLCLPGLMVPFLLPHISTETLLSVSSIECSNHSHYHLGVCILGAWIMWVSPMTLELCLFCHYTFCLVLAFRKLRHGSMLRGSISLTLGFWNYLSFSAFCLFPYSS